MPRGAAFTCVDLAPYFDDTGTTTADATTHGAFNIWGNTLPAEELPEGEVVVGGIPFSLPEYGKRRPDNVRARGQSLSLRQRLADWIYVLAAAERRTEDAVELRYADGVGERAWLRVSDFWPETPPRFGELEALRCTRMHYPRHVHHGMAPVIWQQRVGVRRRVPLRVLSLPDNPALHVFALTLVGP